MWEYNYTYISHSGIKGMKWGVRRWQNEDGSLTPEGRIHYGYQEEYKRAKQDYKQKFKSYNKIVSSPVPNIQKTNKAFKEKNDALTKMQLIKDRNELESHKEKSKRRLKLEEEYKAKGMSEKDAEMAAYKRQKTEKMLIGLAVAGTLTVAALAAYKYRQENVDKIIKAGTTIQNISKDSNKGVKDAFYFSFNKSDNQKYAGWYGKTLLFSDDSDITQTKIKVKENLKVASSKSATKVLQELSQDKNFKSSLAKNIEEANKENWGNIVRNRVISKANKSLQEGKVDKNVYEAFNMMQVYHDKEHQPLNEKFYEALRSKGYDAIGDVNDRKYSGYNTKTATIAFAKAGKLEVESHNLLKPIDIVKANRVATAKEFVKAYTKEASIYGGIGATVMGINNARLKNQQTDKVINQYKKDHPDTKLSNKEILYNYYGIKEG